MRYILERQLFMMGILHDQINILQIPLQNLAHANGVSKRNEESRKPNKIPKVYNEKLRTARMDLMFLVLFPCIFLIFNIVYWVGFLCIIPASA